MYKCDRCESTFETFQLKANHVRWRHKDNSNSNQLISKRAYERYDRELGKHLHEEVHCNNPKGCSSIVSISYRPNKKKKKYFCSRSCANTRIPTDKHKNILKKYYADPQNSFGDQLKKQHGIFPKKYFTSKNERKIIRYFKDNFPNDNWTSGGLLNYKGTRLSRDMYSNKLKICFEYDGIWHFKDIHMQLKSKQFKDRCLEEWCIENNYRLIRIDEDKFINCQQIVDLVYNNTDQIIKIGNRYWG